MWLSLGGFKLGVTLEEIRLKELKLLVVLSPTLPRWEGRENRKGSSEETCELGQDRSPSLAQGCTP